MLVQALTPAQALARLDILDADNRAAGRPCPDLAEWIAETRQLDPAALAVEVSSTVCVSDDDRFTRGDVVEYGPGLWAVVIAPDVLMEGDDLFYVVEGNPQEWGYKDGDETGHTAPPSKWRVEFPDYPADAMPVVPCGFVDESWRNEMCPHFVDKARGFAIFIDYPESDDREFPDTPRFTLHRWTDESGPSEYIAESDDWNALLAAISANTPLKSDAEIAEYAARLSARAVQDRIDFGEG